MIRKLQKKFVLAAVVSVFLVLLLLIGSINILNFRSMVREADGTLQILSANKGSFPNQMRRSEEGPPELDPIPPEAERGGPFGARREGFGELAYQSRFFSVWYGDQGERTRIDLENVATLEQADAEALADAVYAKGAEKGFAQGYRYCRSLCDGETLLLFLNCHREFSTFRSFLYASVGISLIGLLAVFLLLLLFSGRIMRPIAESYEKQKRFITDAGHELKTPVTIIRADADVLASELEDEDNEWLTDIRKQTYRLADLTSDLIYLSKMEEDHVPIQLQDCSLSRLVEENASSFQAPALSQGKRFSLNLQPELRVLGEEKALAKLVTVLLDNAMKYSPEGGAVEVSLSRAGKNARLLVKNSTLPMEKGNADRLFERFTRADSSRSSETGGFGLGLAIARAVVEAHRGRIHAESEDGASLTVTAELPLA